MCKTILVRILAKDDERALRDMLGMFGTAFHDHESYLSNQPDDAYLNQLLADGTFVAIAAFAGNVVVGGLAAYVLRKFEQPRAELYIYDLAVDEAYRRRGIATSMINELRNVALRRGVWVIYVQADYGDDAAVALYSKLGVREDVMHFDILPASVLPISEA
jgi:aminoglycoside 3-N-acetyltransferase I